MDWSSTSVCFPLLMKHFRMYNSSHAENVTVCMPANRNTSQPSQPPCQAKTPPWQTAACDGGERGRSESGFMGSKNKLKSVWLDGNIAVKIIFRSCLNQDPDFSYLELNEDQDRARFNGIRLLVSSLFLLYVFLIRASLLPETTVFLDFTLMFLFYKSQKKFLKLHKVCMQINWGESKLDFDSSKWAITLALVFSFKTKSKTKTGTSPRCSETEVDSDFTTMS